MICFLFFSNYTASFATINAFFGQGTGTIALNNVQCAGTETRLVGCTSGIVASCSHFDDAGVRCQEQTGMLTRKAGLPDCIMVTFAAIFRLQ